MPPGMAVLPARRPPPQCAAPRGRARRVSTSVAPRHAARCLARLRAASSSASSGGAGAGSSGGGGAHLEDANWVQTALNEAVAQEDYARASQCVPRGRRSQSALRASRSLTRSSHQRLRDRLRKLVGEWAGPTDWFGLGLPKWLAERAERMGFRFPTEARARRLCFGKRCSSPNRASTTGAAPRAAARKRQLGRGAAQQHRLWQDAGLPAARAVECAPRKGRSKVARC